jgi:hypothetical protein
LQIIFFCRKVIHGPRGKKAKIYWYDMKKNSGSGKAIILETSDMALT